MLVALYEKVVVPRAVWDEVVRGRPSADGAVTLQQADWIRVEDRELPAIDLGLDPGETAAILLAEALHADSLLIDERLGRKVAQARGIAVRGTLGVLVHARRTGALPALKPVLESLMAAGFRVAPALVREALAQVGELEQ